MPFAAIVAANVVNIPLMRLDEVRNGIQVTDKDGNKLGDVQSKVSLTLLRSNWFELSPRFLNITFYEFFLFLA